MPTSLRTRDAVPRLASNDRATSMTTSTATLPGDRPHHSPQKPQSYKASQTEPIPAQSPREPPLRPKRSRTSSLFNLFTKPNVERAKGHSEPVPPLPNLPVSRDVPERPATRVSTRSRSGSHVTIARNESPPPAIPERPPSRKSLRRLSIPRSSAPNATSKSGASRLDAPWDPPPLFQAYPQAIKHMSLRVPGPTYDSSNRNSTIGWGNTSTRSRNSIFGMPKSSKPARKGAQHVEREGWSKKIYVLVTTGHVLEYAGDGPYDRLPEQILRLGKDSAAFASDLIPGYPYVLQVLQTATGGVQVVQLPQKSLLSRLGLQLPSTRRLASNLLLVFEEPEQMDSWMVAIRKEIEALGGKKCRPVSTVERPFDNFDAASISSQRYQNLQKAPSAISTRASSIKSIPSLRTMPLSPTALPSNRTDSATFTAIDAKWPDTTPEHRYADHTNYALQPDSFANKFDAVQDFTESHDRTTIPMSRTLTPPLQTATQDFSDFYFTDHTPEEISAMHPAHRPSSMSPASLLLMKARRKSIERALGATFGAESQHLPVEPEMESHQDLSPNSDDRPWQSAEPQSTSTARAYKSWSSNTATPRFSLGPKVYSQSVTSFQSSNGAIESFAEQAPLYGGTIHPPPDEIGLGIDSYCSATTDSTQSASTCSEVSTMTEVSSFTSTRVSTSLSPFILQSSFPQSPTLSQSHTPRPYQPRKVLHCPPTPLQIPPRAAWQNSPNPGDTRSGDTTPSPSLSNVLRRPASLPVHSDPAPFLASVAKVKGVNHQQRTSVLVPIIRPGTLKTSRKQKMASLMVDLPPQMPPPTSPLPVPPGIAV